MPIKQLVTKELKEKVDDFVRGRELVKTKIFFRKITADYKLITKFQDIICKFDMVHPIRKLTISVCSHIFWQMQFYFQTVLLWRDGLVMNEERVTIT